MTTARLHAVVLLLAIALLGGCASYATPGRGADLAAIAEITPQERDAATQQPILRKLELKPLASFPTAIAVARLQSPGYRSRTLESYGSGRYSVVTTRDVETEAHFERLGKLPMVKGIAAVSRLLLPPKLDTEMDLRQAAASLHTDMLLIYTIDTTFAVRDNMTPLSVISLGLFPTQNAEVVTTASAVLLDTRNGYVYGTAEATSRKDQIASAWTNSDAVDQVRLKTEAEAFDKLIGEFEKTWQGVLTQNHKPMAVQ